MKLEAVKQNCFAIIRIPNPSEQVQLEAVKENPEAFEDIKSPTEKVKQLIQRNNA